MMFLLDVLVEDATLYRPCAFLTKPIWITVSADGLSQTFCTSQVAPSPHPSWHLGARLVLKIPTLDGRHFRVHLSTFGSGGSPVTVCTSQVRLASLPFGRPCRFSFPLMMGNDKTIQGATLKMTATISSLSRPVPHHVMPIFPKK